MSHLRVRALISFVYAGSSLVTPVLSFDIIYADYDIESMTEWEDIRRYDDKMDEYVEITGFSSISNPKLDSEGEYIFGSHRDTAAMHSYYVYIYSNGQFIEVYWLSSDYSDGEEIWCVNEVEIGRTNNINDLSTIKNPVFELFYREDGSRNPRIVNFVIY